MQRSSISVMPDKKIEENELYIPLVDLSIFEESNIKIDPYSLELLKAGEVDQRYAVVGFVESNTLYLYFRPSFSAVDKPTKTDSEGKPITEAEAEETFLKEVPRAKNFSAKDRVFAHSGMSGIVHEETIDSIWLRNKELQLQNPDNVTMPGISSLTQMGLSFYKRSDDLNLLDWVSRSTKNFSIFSVHPLAERCFYFYESQTNFVRPKYTREFHLARTLEQKSFEKMILAIRNKVLMVKDSKELKEAHNKLLKDIIKKNEDTYVLPKWKKIRNNKNLMANHLMRTIYYASGMEGVHDRYQFKNNHVVSLVIDVAKKYNILLNLNYIPSQTEEKKQDTALINACRMGDYISVEILLNYDHKKEIIDYCNVPGETPVIVAVNSGHLDIANLLIKKGVEVTETLKEAILHQDIIKAREIIIKDSLIEPRVEFIKNLEKILANMHRWYDIKIFIETLPTYGLTFDNLYLEDSKEAQTFKRIVCDHITTLSTLGKVSELEKIEKIFPKDFFTKILNFHDLIHDSVLIATIMSSRNSDPNRASAISWLLEKKVDTCLCSDGETALMRAVEKNDLETIKKILTHSTASLNVIDMRCWSALIYAVSEKNVAIFNYLLEAKAEFNPCQALSLAAKKKDKQFTLEILESLLIATIKRRHIDLLQVLPKVKRYILDLKDQEIIQDAIFESYNKILTCLEKNEKENTSSSTLDESKSNLQRFGLLKSKQNEEYEEPRKDMGLNPYQIKNLNNNK